MSSSSPTIRPSLARWLQLSRRAPVSIAPLARGAALSLLLLYGVVTTAAYLSTRGPGTLSIGLASCGEALCVSSVIPGGVGWYYQISPGMQVVSVNGQGITTPTDPSVHADPMRELQVVGDSGDLLSAAVLLEPVSRSPLKFSVWLVSGIFTLLGALVVLRRPDHKVSWTFLPFAGMTALALAVGPASGGPAPPWARIVQGVTLMGIGMTAFPFAASLTAQAEKRRNLRVVIILAVGTTLIIAYVASLFFRPLFELVRPLTLLYVSVSIVGSIVFLAVKGMRPTSPTSRQQVRIILWGITLGALPFVALTLIPEAFGLGSAVPVEITILAWGAIPVAIAYAILQYQLLGIRRLIHRGMVYGLATFMMLIIVSLVLQFISFQETLDGRVSNPVVVSLSLVGGVLLFLLLQRCTRWLVDNLLYHDVVDYRVALETFQRDFPAPNVTSEVVTVIADRLARMMHLESVLVFLGDGSVYGEPAGSAGQRSQEMLSQAYPRLRAHIDATQDGGLAELRWQADSLLDAQLVVGGQRLGHILLGPKAGGEVFVEAEKRFATALTSLLALTIHKSELSEELRGVNQRLVKMEETERARMAGDLHDGPLQKAMVLAGGVAMTYNSHSELARELVFELREICSRLRPAILDDLGLVPALEWLTNLATARNGIEARVILCGVGEEERFPSDTELALFRITQEAINNTVKHAQATSLSVSLAKEGGCVVLTVSDDGVGFDVASYRNKGFGLSGMRERVFQLGGSLKINSHPGSGTMVTASVPLVQGNSL